VKDYVYIGGLIDGMYKTATSGAVHRVFHVGSGIGHSVNDRVGMIAWRVDRPVSVRYGPRGTFDVSRIYLDIARARKEPGWEPGIFLNEVLRRTWEFA